MSVISSLGSKIFDPLLDVVATKTCYVCDARLNQSSFICDNCLEDMPLPPDPEEVLNILINAFPGDDLAISKAFSLLRATTDSPYMDLIHSMKYQSFENIGKMFGKLLGEYLFLIEATNYDRIVPIPIHSARLRERSFNQAEAIARGISDVLQIPIDNKTLHRKKYTQTQTKLSQSERKQNVKDVFGVESLELIGEKILLVDDVMTTGSTLNYSAEMLLERGARFVHSAVILIPDR
jgi:ComF family protein